MAFLIKRTVKTFHVRGVTERKGWSGIERKDEERTGFVPLSSYWGLDAPKLSVHHWLCKSPVFL
jgi:hypothetical protein